MLNQRQNHCTTPARRRRPWKNLYRRRWQHKLHSPSYHPHQEVPKSPPPSTPLSAAPAVHLVAEFYTRARVCMLLTGSQPGRSGPNFAYRFILSQGLFRVSQSHGHSAIGVTMAGKKRSECHTHEKKGATGAEKDRGRPNAVSMRMEAP